VTATRGDGARPTKAKKAASKRPAAKAAAKPAAAPAAGNGKLRGDQFGAIFAKGLDLAEASLSLGLTMITRVGVAAQHQMERMASALPQEPAMAPDPGPRQGPPPPQEPAGPVSADERQYGISNRQPATQGGVVRIPFSINNDSVSSTKSVTLRADHFVGELEGARIDAERFSVKPARRRIAPLDFEKFVLEASIPANVPSDVYHGAVVVSSGQAFSIPVRLVVQGT
jgi:hypothetical protein